jgi:predicted amidohydrolase
MNVILWAAAWLLTAQEAGGWKPWAPREEIRPRCAVDTEVFRSAPDSLSISGAGNPAAHGGWKRDFPVEAGKHYRLTAFFRLKDVEHARLRVLARIDWRDKRDQRAGYPDYAWQVEPAGEWTKVSLLAPAPEKAAAARVELSLGESPRGTVWWDDVTLEEAPPPPPRPVRLGSVSFRPRNTGSRKGSLDAFLQMLDKIGPEKPDVVCLGEAITKVGNNDPYAAVAEPIPGPSTEALGAKAKQHGMYVVAGLTEKEGNAVYNTGVLIDRQGKLAGKYRKVHLPREEIEAGITPGDAYPVFETDFGRVGIMICYDIFFSDPAKALAAQGAEIIFAPVWGCKYDQLKVRASENHVIVVSAGYDVETAVINPLGEALHATKESGVVKVVPVDLAQRYVEPWLGEMRGRFHKELRWDVPIPEPPK